VTHSQFFAQRAFQPHTRDEYLGLQLALRLKRTNEVVRFCAAVARFPEVTIVRAWQMCEGLAAEGNREFFAVLESLT